MKMPGPIPFSLSIALLLVTPLANARPPRITYTGGDGSSLEKAVVIKGGTEETGVHAEYEYLDKHFPGYKRGGQSLQHVSGKAYDVLEFTTANGKPKTIYFDISDFFGK